MGRGPRDSATPGPRRTWAVHVRGVERKRMRVRQLRRDEGRAEPVPRGGAMIYEPPALLIEDTSKYGTSYEAQVNPVWLAAHDAEVARKVKVETLREAVADMRRAWEGSWNLRDPRDPEVAYSVDVW